MSLCIAILLTTSRATFAQGERRPGSSGFPETSPGVAALDPNTYGTIDVFLRGEDGKPISDRRLVTSVRIFSNGSNVPLPNLPTATGDKWVFSGMSLGGDYDVGVSVPGYYNAFEHVHVPNRRTATVDVIVLMRPVDQELVYRPPNGNFELPPKAQKEIQRSLDDLLHGHVQSSFKHNEKALQAAADNPYVEYITGLTYLFNNQFQEAKPFLEKSVSIDWKEPLALSALGTVRYRLGDDAGAVEVLSKAVQLDPTMWKAEWTLAVAYLAEKKYTDAREHAEQAIKVGKDKASRAQLALGQALAGLGERGESAELFDKFATEYPKDPDAANARKWAELMRQPVQVNFESSPGAGEMSGAPAPPIEVPPRPNWAPPDVDAVAPFLISGATCPLEQVLKAAGEHAEEFVFALERFSATEEFQAIEMKRDGSLDKPSAQSYNYFVFVRRPTPALFQIEEVREQRSQPVGLSARVSDLGVPGLALAFHPSLRDSLQWECEGLGKWNDQPAWVVHFRQRPDKPSVLAGFTTPSGNYTLPLKGRAWLAQQGEQILHLETDLVQELPPVNLKREHFAVDYTLVSFQAHNVDLWVPENVDAYIQFQGHFLHNYHRFSNFKLFWVGSSQTIGEPKKASQPAQQQTEQHPRIEPQHQH